MMLNLEVQAEFCDHSIVNIGTIICDDPFRDAIPTNQVVLDEPGNQILSDRGERSRFNPFCKIVNNDEDEAVSIRGSKLDFSNHIKPHIANGQGAVMTLKGTRGT